MAKVVNARTAAGTLLSFAVDKGKFRRVTGQAALERAPAAVRLAAVQDFAALAEDQVVDAAEALLVPGGIDAHVHSRDPGLTRKEDWQTLARGAFRGGVVAVADMPNTLPPTMTRAAVLAKAELARAAGIDFKLLAGVGVGNVATVGELLADPELPICALKVFYGKTTGELMYDDLETLARVLPADGKKLIVFHSEDQCTVDCNEAKHLIETTRRDNAAFAVHSAIRSSAAAHASTKTILQWAKTSYRRPIHIAHVSTPVEVELIAEAKAAGVKVTSEVAPHHLLFTTDAYAKLGALVKMNPPLRSPAEVEKLRALVGQGLVEVFATDHAPHLLSEKDTDVAHAPSGVPGVELFYPLLFACARVTGLKPAAAVAMASEHPAKLFGFPAKGQIADGFDADFACLKEATKPVAQADVVSKCGWTPYAGFHLPYQVTATWTHGRQTYAGTP